MELPDKEWVETLPYEADPDDTFWRHMATRIEFHKHGGPEVLQA